MTPAGRPARVLAATAGRGERQAPAQAIGLRGERARAAELAGVPGDWQKVNAARIVRQTRAESVTHS